jgi:hypothetical protein
VSESDKRHTSILIPLLVCGKTGIRGSNRDDPKIVGGTDASKGDAPWQVGLVLSSTRDCVCQSQILFSHVFEAH